MIQQPKIQEMTAGDFYRAFPEIANEKAITAIKRFRHIDGYYIPAEQYQAFLKYQHSVRGDKQNDSTQ